jgi:ribonucleases P/MRP protein subunit RPP40
VVKKAKQSLGLVRRSFTYMDRELIKQLLTSIIRPHLGYCNVVWHPYFRKGINKLEAVQHRATRMIHGMAKLTFEEKLRQLDLPQLVYRRTLCDAMILSKCIIICMIFRRTLRDAMILSKCIIICMIFRRTL